MGARRRPLQPCRGGRASAGSVLGAVVFEAGLVCLLLLGSWQDEGINGAREHIATGATVAEIHGAVHDEHGSVEGAVVRIQATGNATSTDNTGRFLLTDLDPGAPVTVSAWKWGYYCAKVEEVVPPADDVVLALRRYQTGDNADYEWMPPIGEEDVWVMQLDMPQDRMSLLSRQP